MARPPAWWAGPATALHLLARACLGPRPSTRGDAAGVRAAAADRIFVHDYLTADGKKISKSGAGPPATIGSAGAGALSRPRWPPEYGADAVRWWLLREVPRSGTPTSPCARLVARADDELANGLGNLVNRVTRMIARYQDGQLPSGPGRPAAPGGERLAAACRQVGDAAVACRKSKFSSAAPTASPAWRHAAASLSPPGAAGWPGAGGS